MLDATTGGTPGYYVYTATPSGGNATSINAASYLPIGTSALSVLFVPPHATDYVGSTATVPTFTVTQATTYRRDWYLAISVTGGVPQNIVFDALGTSRPATLTN